MKTKSALLRSIGVLMALLVFVALPNSVLANPCGGPPHDPYCELYYGTGTNLFLELGTDCPTGATIFYTRTTNQPNYVDPTHSGTTPGYLTYSCPIGTKIPIPYGSTIYIRALAWRVEFGDSGVTACDQHNPNL
jgi:hypothetical protein